MVNDCVTQTLFNMMKFQGNKYYANLSQRFHFALSKMIDGSNAYGGFSGIAGVRAWEGWIPCSEQKFPSDRNMPEATYGNWRLIPQRAWKDSQERTIKYGYQHLSYFKNHPQRVSRLEKILNEYYLLAQKDIGFKTIDGSDDIFFFQIFSLDYMIIAWMNISAFWLRNFVRINDLYVKSEFRGAGLEKQLLRTLVDWLSTQEIQKGNFKVYYFLPVIDVFTPERKKESLDYVRQSGFEIRLLKSSPLINPDYSRILAEYTI